MLVGILVMDLDEVHLEVGNDEHISLRQLMILMIMMIMMTLVMFMSRLLVMLIVRL